MKLNLSPIRPRNLIAIQSLSHHYPSLEQLSMATKFDGVFRRVFFPFIFGNSPLLENGPE